MSLKVRIFLSMGAIVALVIFVGGFASLKTNSLSKTFIEYRETARTSLLANEMSQGLANMRLAALKYRQSADPAMLEDVSENVANFSRLAPDFLTALDGYPERAGVEKIPQLMREYESSMQQVSELQKRNAEFADSAAASGQAARQTLTETIASSKNSNDILTSSSFGVVAVKLLLGRLYLERFLFSNDQSDFDRSELEIEGARQGLNQLAAETRDPTARSSAESTVADLDKFSTVSTQLFENVRALGVLYDRLDEIGPEVLALMGSAVGAVVDRQNTLGPAGIATGRNSITVVVTLVAIGALVGLLLAYFTGRKISGQLARVTEDMTQLADGNLDIEIETTDRHEIGKMTDAMAVFLKNARTARELDAEIKDTERKEQERIEEERARESRLEEKQRREEAERQADRTRLTMLEDFQKDMERVMDESASGNFSVRMSDAVDDENLVKLANLVNGQLQVTETNIADIMTSIGELAKGNLAVRIDGNRHGVFLAMQEDFNASMDVLSQTMSRILQSGTSVSGTSIDLKNSSKDMSKRAEDNAATVEETSAAVEEITASIRQVVASAKAADQATQRVRQSADETRSVSTETEASINEMTDASAQINRVVKVIEDIAFQINLLALNAGVEAARAGEAGLGFSVVASEVRALALRSQEAVQEITQVIEQSNLSVEAGAHQVGLSRQALEGIITEVEVASGQISEIASAVEEQAKGIEEVNTAIRAIDVNAQKNARTLETMMLSSESLSDEAGQLSSALGEFKGVAIDLGHTNAKRLPPKEPKNRAADTPRPKQQVAVAAGHSAVVASADDEGWDEF